MILFLNGEFVPETEACIPASDRGFLYGDGLFETLPVYNSRPWRWAEHWQRLERGAAVLGLPLPFPEVFLAAAANELIRRNCMPEAILRLVVSRGSGSRGYSPRGVARPSTVMSLHPPSAWPAQAPPPWRLATSSIALPTGQVLCACKTCNRLPYILARAQAERRGADEALLLNSEGHVAEAASANLFCIEGGTVCTPPLDQGALDGITRGIVLGLCPRLGLETREKPLRPASLHSGEGVFATLSTLGLVEVTELDGQPLEPWPLLGELRSAYLALVKQETGWPGQESKPGQGDGAAGPGP